MDGKVKRTWSHEDVRQLPPVHQQNDLFKKSDDVKRIITDAENYWRDQFDIVIEDRRMYGGEQWLVDDEEKRANDRRPAPVISKIATYADYMHGMIDNERLTVNVMEHDLPGENTSGSARFTGVETQEPFSRSGLLEAHIDHILYDSDFPEQRSDATHKLLTTGMAYFRLHLDYDDGDPDNLTFKLKSIHDPLDVLMDPTFREPGASDASWCAIQSWVNIDVAKKKWPGSNIEKLRRGGAIWQTADRDDFWVDATNRVRVVELFQVVEVKERRIFLTDGSDMAEADYHKVVKELQEAGIAPVGAREFCKNHVYLTRWLGDETITGPTLLPYDRLPVYPVFGRRKHYNNKVVYYSILHEATDVQRMVNYAAAQLMIQASRSGSAPWVATPEAIAGHLKKYADPMNQDNVMFYNARGPGGEPQPPPARQQPLSGDPVTLQTLQFANSQLSDIIGIDEAGLGRNSNAISARSSEVRIAAQQQNFTAFVRSLTHAVESACETIVRAIPQVYDEDRFVRVRMRDGRSDWVRINSDFITAEDGEKVPVNGLYSKNNMTVRIQAAPSDETQKQATVKHILELMKVSPQLAQLYADRVVRYSDSKLSEELGDRALAMLDPAMMSPDERDIWIQMQVDGEKTKAAAELRVATEVTQPMMQARQELGIEPPAPPPEVQLQQAKVEEVQARAQKEIGQTQAQAALRDAKIAQTQAQTQGAAAKDAAKLAGQQMQNKKAQAELEGNTREQLQDMVNEAVLRVVPALLERLGVGTGAPPATDEEGVV